MPHFAYKARSTGGELVQGVLESPDSGAAATQLFNLGITPVEITPTASPPSSGGSFAITLFQEKVTQLDLMLFSRQMYTLLKAGVPIMRALAGLQESTTNKTFAAVIKDIRESLDAGRELSPSLARQPQVFTPFYVNMVRVGEMTGQLEEIFLRMFHHLDFDKFMREQVKSASLGSLGTITLPLASSNINESDTIVRVQDGTIAAIGGLMKQSQGNNRAGVPGTLDSTFLSNVFGSRSQQLSKSELVILIKTTIIKGDAAWQLQAQEINERMQNLRRPAEEKK